MTRKERVSSPKQVLLGWGARDPSQGLLRGQSAAGPHPTPGIHWLRAPSPGGMLLGARGMLLAAASAPSPRACLKLFILLSCWQSMPRAQEAT